MTLKSHLWPVHKMLILEVFPDFSGANSSINPVMGWNLEQGVPTVASA